MLTILSALFSSTKYHGRICGRNPNYRSTTPGPLSCVRGHRIRPPFATLRVATHNDEKDPFLAVSLSSPLVPPRLSTNSNMLTSRRLQELLRRSLLRQPRPLANDRLASSVDVPGSGCKTLHGQRFLPSSPVAGASRTRSRSQLRRQERERVEWSSRAASGSDLSYLVVSTSTTIPSAYN